MDRALVVDGSVKAYGEWRTAWERWKTWFKQLPDGSWFNPEGIEDQLFFHSLAEIRQEPWAFLDPFGA